VTVGTAGARAWIPDRTTTGFDGAEEFRRAHLWIERVGRAMERLVIVAARVDLDDLLPAAPEQYGYQVATRRLHIPVRHPAAVLALWPEADLLERAQRKSVGGALCVVSARPGDVEAWRARATPTDLAVAFDDGEAELHPDVRAALDLLVRLGAREQMADATSRAASVRTLRRLVADGHRPDGAAIERYVSSTGLVNHRGARRIREVYEAVRKGEPFRIHGHAL
jgi:hypothetical protein